MTLTCAEIKQLPNNEQGTEYRKLAKTGDSKACLEYAQLVFTDKYKGDKVGGKIPDIEKVAARNDAVAFLLSAANDGDLKCAMKGLESTYLGVFGGFGKVLCKVSYSTALMFINALLEHHPIMDDETKAQVLLYRGMCLLLGSSANERAWDEITTSWQQALTYSGKYAELASVSYGSYLYDHADYEAAIKYLSPIENSITAITLLMLIYKNHKPSNELYISYKDKCLALSDPKKK